VLTDNRNRTASEIRSAFSKNGGSLGETGSLGFVFKRKGVIKFNNEKFDEDTFFEQAADAGAEDIISEKNEHTAICVSEEFGKVRDTLTDRIGDPSSAKLEWVPQNLQPINEEQADKILKFIDILEDNDDVQTVYTNLDVSEEVMDKIKNK
jgi:YebC/PmpR family DNA-binding regulatory protein